MEREDNIVVFISGERGLETISQLIKNKIKIAKVVLTVGFKFTSFFENHVNLNIEKTKDVNSLDFINKLSNLKPDIFIVAGFPQIFSKKLLTLPSKLTINQHAGLLPKYRGGSPLNWQIINGEKNIGISLIKMDEGIDSGDIISEESFLLDNHENIYDAHCKTNKLFAVMTIKALNLLKQNKLFFKKQKEKNAIYWHQRGPIDGKIFWKDSKAIDIINLIRAITFPYPGAYTFKKNFKVIIFSAIIPEIQIKGNPGRVLYIQGKGPYIVCRDRAILLTKYVIEKLEDSKLLHGDYLS